ncbi:GNAT family N-acetyltransferase [Actinacidiphila sp. DG2A-62]|uniref:GNAT family N-acetyltransferase n=1 Tax=Actinacidiphila sp. DG2A-62 TaxID=3108821 RepID=UPI002DBCF6FD|nr:GNAT family N-acetyltransferase [Actinacidiphila sp. DG2A-62]MEC3995468.1 GNAT family N-acetyltransferase [Actinacidiphila sp. DG2A-62]
MTRRHPDPSASVAVDPAPRLPSARTPGAGPPRAPGPGPAAGALRVEICRDAEEFAALAGEWDALYRRCGDAVTAFQSHAWLHSWWASYGRRGRLRVVLVRRVGADGEGGENGGARTGGDRGELVAAAPLMRAYRPLPVLVALGGAITDYTDVLIAPGADTTHDADASSDTCGPVPAPSGPDDRGPDPASPARAPVSDEPVSREPAADVLDALAAGVRRAARGGPVDLREVRPGGGAERLYARWRGPKRQLAGSVCLELPGAPMDGLIARVGSSRGQRVRKELRALDRAGLTGYDVAPADVPRAVATMLRLHLAQWRGRGMTPEHRRPRFAAHLTRAAALMVASGDAAVTEYRRGGPDGEVVAVGLTVLSPAWPAATSTAPIRRCARPRSM